MVQTATDARHASCGPAVASAARGFTLVEMLIALVILSIAILGMTSLTLTTIRTNQGNDLRNAAVRVTSEVVEEQLSLPIESVVSGTETRQVSIRGTNVPFTVTRTMTPLTTDLRQVDITVTYTVNGVNRINSAVIYKHRAS